MYHIHLHDYVYMYTNNIHYNMYTCTHKRVDICILFDWLCDEGCQGPCRVAGMVSITSRHQVAGFCCNVCFEDKRSGNFGIGLMHPALEAAKFAMILRPWLKSAALRHLAAADIS